MAFCANCGFSFPEGSEFCPNCGTKVAGAAGAQPAASAPQTQQYQQQQQYYPPRQPSLVSIVLKKSFAFVMAKPIRLWGISLLNGLLCILATVFCSGFLLAGLAIGWVLEMGMTIVFLEGYRGKEVNCDQLFKGFKTFFRSAGGMGWRYLWIFIWSLIPIVGFVFRIIKGYSYSFVPYILDQESETSATEALRKSMAQTEGFKGQMFLADFLVGIVIGAAILVLFLLSLIPYIGILFGIILFVVVLVVVCLAPLVFGTIQAAFYDEITKIQK